MVVPQIGAFEARVEPASAAQASRVSALEAAAVSTSDAEAAARRAVAAVAALEARFAVADAPLRDCAGAIEGADSYDEYAAAERAYDALLASARADFPGGDAAMLYRSIRKILALPDSTRMFVGHDYLPAGRTEFAWETTVTRQRAENIHIHARIEEAAFVAMRHGRDATLAAPVLILPSLQVNIRAGALPSPSPSGRIFLRIPVTLA